MAAVNTKTNEIQPIHVLFVEDEFLISEMVAEALCEQGFRVYTADNGTDALRYLAAAPVDVLFTDINLPGAMDGTVLARRARELMPDLPVVYASGRIDALDVALRVPGSIFLAKPYAPAQIGSLLVSAMKTASPRSPA